jgi:hypothetical protein
MVKFENVREDDEHNDKKQNIYCMRKYSYYLNNIHIHISSK